MVRLRPAASWRAEALGTNPSSAMADSTRARVAGRTESGRFRTLETVPSDTPALAATSLMLTDAIRTPFDDARYRDPRGEPCLPAVLALMMAGTSEGPRSRRGGPGAPRGMAG